MELRITHQSSVVHLDILYINTDAALSEMDAHVGLEYKILNFIYNIFKIMIIGTHDSCAYKLNFKIGFWSPFDKWTILRRLCRFLPCIKCIVSNNTLTQELSVYEQLQGGSRVFDIRVSYKDGVFYTNHTFCCGTLDEMLDQFEEYLNENCVDIVLLIKPDWHTRYTMKSHEIELVQHINSRFDNEKLEYYYKAFNNNVFKEPFVKNFNSLDFKWLNADNIDDFKTKYSKLDMNPNKTILNFVLTTSDNATLPELIDSSIEEYAEQINPLVFDLLKQDNLPYIILFDFIDKEFIDQLNSWISNKFPIHHIK